jgi:hypothetical protein
MARIANDFEARRKACMVGSSANGNGRNFVEYLREFEAFRNLLELRIEVNQTRARPSFRVQALEPLAKVVNGNVI